MKPYREIADEVGIDELQCKTSFYKAISRFKGNRNNPTSPFHPQLHEILSCLEESLDYEYCIENFSELCGFCLRLRCDVVSVQEILDDLGDEKETGVAKFIEKIQFTLFDNVSFYAASFEKITTRTLHFSHHRASTTR